MSPTASTATPQRQQQPMNEAPSKLEVEMQRLMQCEEMKKHIQMQVIRDRVYGEEMVKLRAKKNEISLQTAQLQVEKARLIGELRKKQHEKEMLEDQAEKMAGYSRTLLSHCRDDNAFNAEETELANIKEKSKRLAERVIHSPWLPEKEELRKGLEEDEALLEQERGELAELQASTDEIKTKVALCEERSFVDVVVKLAKYRMQQGEMYNFFVKELGENLKLAALLKKQQKASEAAEQPDESRLPSSSAVAQPPPTRIGEGGAEQHPHLQPPIRAIAIGNEEDINSRTNYSNNRCQRSREEAMEVSGGGEEVDDRMEVEEEEEPTRFLDDSMDTTFNEDEINEGMMPRIRAHSPDASSRANPSLAATLSEPGTTMVSMSSTLGPVPSTPRMGTSSNFGSQPTPKQSHQQTPILHQPLHTQAAGHSQHSGSGKMVGAAPKSSHQLQQTPVPQVAKPQSPGQQFSGSGKSSNDRASPVDHHDAAAEEQRESAADDGPLDEHPSFISDVATGLDDTYVMEGSASGFNIDFFDNQDGGSSTDVFGNLFARVGAQNDERDDAAHMGFMEPGFDIPFGGVDNFSFGGGCGEFEIGLGCADASPLYSTNTRGGEVSKKEKGKGK